MVFDDFGAQMRGSAIVVELGVAEEEEEGI